MDDVKQPATPTAPDPRVQAALQAAFEHVTTNRHQRRARAKLKHGSAVMNVRKATKKARHAK